MADTKISDLAAVTDVLATDEYVLARSGATKKIDASNLLVASEVAFTPTGTIASTDVQAAIAEVATEAGASVATGDALITIFAFDSPVTASTPAIGSWLQTDNNANNQLWRYTLEQTTPAINDYIEWPTVMMSGTWNITIMGVKFTNGGIITVSLNGTSVGTLDQYNGSAAYNQYQTITGITVATSGLKLLRCTAASKNGSSSGYAMRITRVYAIRTGA